MFLLIYCYVYIIQFVRIFLYDGHFFDNIYVVRIWLNVGHFCRKSLALLQYSGRAGLGSPLINIESMSNDKFVIF